jgi:hypothetical protein
VGSAAWREANAHKVRGYWRAWYYRNRETVCVARRRRKRHWAESRDGSAVEIERHAKL